MGSGFPVPPSGGGTIIGGGLGAAIPLGMSFVSGQPTGTRRSTLSFCGDGFATTQPPTNNDACQRYIFTLPVNLVRVRFRIANSSLVNNVKEGGPAAFTGIWWGTPNLANADWLGDFTATPTQIVSSFNMDSAGDEVVTAWVPASSIPGSGLVANKPQAISIGFTTTAATVASANTPSVSAQGTGSAAAAGGQALPATTQRWYMQWLDVRMEFEFIGANPIGLFIGDSLTDGWVNANTAPQPTGSTSAIGEAGANASWPNKLALQLGHVAINAGVGGAVTANFTTPASQLAWTRFDLATCVPDYAVIALGINDAATNVSLATFKANIQTIISYLISIGILRIYLCTIVPGPTSPFGTSASFTAGILSTAIAPGAITTVKCTAAVDGAGNSSWFQASGGPFQLWLELPNTNLAEGPFTITGVSVTGNIVTLTSSFTAVFNHAINNCIVMATREGLRQNYNHFLAKGVPGVLRTFDISAALEQPYTPGAGAISAPFQLGAPNRAAPYYYSTLSSFDPHPQYPRGYGLWAEAMDLAVV